MRFSILPLAISLLSLPSVLAQAVTNFTGTGEIWVLDSNNVGTVTPAARVGCLNTAGRFITTSTGCGVFSKEANPQMSTPLLSPLGKCSFLDTTSEPGPPASTQFYALKCGPGPRASEGDVFYGYTNPQGVTSIWWGNLNNRYLVQSFPAAGASAGLWPVNGAPAGAQTSILLMWNRLS